jgi:hypothetical protein
MSYLPFAFWLILLDNLDFLSVPEQAPSISQDHGDPSGLCVFGPAVDWPWGLTYNRESYTLK